MVGHEDHGVLGELPLGYVLQYDEEEGDYLERELPNLEDEGFELVSISQLLSSGQLGKES